MENSHRAKLDRILSVHDGARTPRVLFGDTDDEFWLWCFTDGYRSDERLRSILPRFPPDEVQYRFAGAAGDDTMKDAFSIYRLLKSLADQHLRRPLDSALEFGCGWGRIVRLFTRDVDPRRLWGIDCLPVAIDICKQTNPYTQFELVDPFPPTRVPSDAFSMVYAYSVFSHLSEAAHLAWLGEFERILRPGGLLVATTRPRDFILTCAQLREAGEQRTWAQGTVLAFQDTAKTLARYDRGEYLFEPMGGGDVLDASFFGETCIPHQYVVENWTQLFEFVGFLDDRRLCQQNVIVARKT
jgi:SAM-dependent methyltransferase